MFENTIDALKNFESIIKSDPPSNCKEMCKHDYELLCAEFDIGKAIVWEMGDMAINVANTIIALSKNKRGY